MQIRSLAVGVAVLFAPLPLVAQEHVHDHEHGTHSHRGPGPHFIDAFFVENAYIERKVRPDLGFATGPEGDRFLGQVEVEWALLAPLSLIVHAPFEHRRPEVGDAETGIRDISVGAKYAIVNDRSRFILAVGSDLSLPTGDETIGFGEEHAAAAPFLLTWLPFGPERRFLFQTSWHVDIPLAGDEGEHAEIGTALSWTSSLGITPLLEGLVEFPLENGDPSWFVAPGIRWEFLPAWEAGASARVPVSGPESDEEDFRIVVGLIRHFALPG